MGRGVLLCVVLEIEVFFDLESFLGLLFACVCFGSGFGGFCSSLSTPLRNLKLYGGARGTSPY